MIDVEFLVPGRKEVCLLLMVILLGQRRGMSEGAGVSRVEGGEGSMPRKAAQEVGQWVEGKSWQRKRDAYMESTEDGALSEEVRGGCLVVEAMSG